MSQYDCSSCWPGSHEKRGTIAGPHLLLWAKRLALPSPRRHGQLRATISSEDPRKAPVSTQPDPCTTAFLTPRQPLPSIATAPDLDTRSTRSYHNPCARG